MFVFVSFAFSYSLPAPYMDQRGSGHHIENKRWGGKKGEEVRVGAERRGEAETQTPAVQLPLICWFGGFGEAIGTPTPHPHPQRAARVAKSSPDEGRFWQSISL